MDVFELRDRLIDGYRDYTQSFVEIRDDRLRDALEAAIEGGSFWPEPLIQLSPSFRFGGSIDGLVDQGVLHSECRRIFRAKKTKEDPVGVPLRLYRHQVDAIHAAAQGRNYVLTT